MVRPTDAGQKGVAVGESRVDDLPSCVVAMGRVGGDGNGVPSNGEEGGVGPVGVEHSGVGAGVGVTAGEGLSGGDGVESPPRGVEGGGEGERSISSTCDWRM